MGFDGSPLPLPPDEEFATASWHHRLTAKDSRFVGERFSQPVLHVLYEYALARNAWGTTNIDAAPIDVDRVGELYDAHQHNATHLIKIAPPEREVVNYFDLLSDLPRRRWPLTVDDIQWTHRAYFHDVPLDNKGVPGQWKRDQNVILGPGNHVTPTTPPEQVDGQLAELCAWWNRQDGPSPAHVALFFYAFQRIHPFADGNGRLGRVLCLQLLSSLGLENIRYCAIYDTLHQERREYLESLFEADLGRPSRWLGLFHAAISDGYQRAERLGRRLQAIPHEVAEQGFALVAWAILNGHRSFTPSDIGHIWRDYTQRTRRRHLAKLVDLGILRQHGRSRDRAFSLAPGFLVERDAIVETID